MTVSQAVDLRAVATEQRGLIACLLINLCCLAATVGLRGSPAAIVPTLLYVPVTVAGLIFVALMATRLYGTAVGVTLGVICIVPLLNLLILLAVNSRATKVLRASGVRVGFLGATVPPTMPPAVSPTVPPTV